MAKQTKEKEAGGGLLDDLPTDELKDQTRELMAALGERAMTMVTDKVGDLTGRLVDYVENGGSSADDGAEDGDSKGGSKGHGLPMGKLLGIGATGVKNMVMNKIGGGGGKGGGKITTILEQIEVGVPVRVAYDEWTQFQSFPKFTKRIESVDQESDEKVSWKAGIYFSHRKWESTIIEQVPDERIVWRSQGDKGYIDGTVTFHEITPDLTKILLVLEYHPQGLFEKTGNAFRSQRRRARLELQQFDRHIMRETILDQDDVEGWRGEIRDGEVVRSHEDALNEEGEEGDEGDEDEYEDQDEEEEPDEDEDLEDEYDEDDEDDDYADEDEDEEPPDDDEDDDDDEDGDEEAADAPEDEYDDDSDIEPDEDEDEDEDEYEDEDEAEDEAEDDDEDEPEPAPARRRRRTPAARR
ncbi:putative membrane protein [Catenulispora sp. GP43]|uniref:SRPBCC family protein n=1 Tax=Catenulispora sp. GP43 TaxID=3156263 RepID=UPI003511654C